MKHILALTVSVAATVATAHSAVEWGTPAAPSISEARGYVSIPNVAIAPDKKRIYRAIYNATLSPREPSQLVPALNMAGGALNAFASTGVPSGNARLVIVFQGAAIDGILDDTRYKEKHGVANPNLKVLSELKKAGVEVFVCGQSILRENIDPKVLSPDVRIASAAQIVLMQYQNDGYALLSY
jgi:intracellular sulfur oxidation DsrE/DsrF family protein